MEVTKFFYLEKDNAWGPHVQAVIQYGGAQGMPATEQQTTKVIEVYQHKDTVLPVTVQLDSSLKE